VAIASLGGPLFVARAALAEVVKYAQSRYEENEQSRQIRRQVADVLGAWADSEQLNGEDVDLGLALAAEIVSRFGLSTDELAELGFAPAAAAEVVVGKAKSNDPNWGTEDHYAVAVRAIGVTYEALMTQLRASDAAVISSFLALRNSISHWAARNEDRFEAAAFSLADLAAALVNVATLADVIFYLRTRIANWDVSVWHHDRRASALEQLLKVRIKDGPSAGESILASAESMAAEQMLVVLGGPGAGKTWLSRRYARQAAQVALFKLEEGARLDEVELPLLTTWEQWTKTAGSPMRSLVTSSFASGLGHSDAGGADALARLERTFLHPETRVLLIVDSLDEAADLAAQGPRLHELQRLPAQWRVVVTSRPAAWSTAYRGVTGSREPRVVELDILSYPEDVDAFIHGWFTTSVDPTRADVLIREIRRRPEVARAAVVPLVLTFYCLLAEDPGATTVPLPARRRELYRRLVRRLLRGAWAANHPGPDDLPDWGYCEQLLRGWAWTAVRDRTDATGLSVWYDSFVQPTPVRPPERRAIDHIAPKTGEDYEGNVTRRFVHRTFLEYFVAEHISTLDTKTAADILLPHLWFDTDWLVTAPAAIVAHNQQRKGELLGHLLSRARHPEVDLAREGARREFERLLLEIAQESEPDEWSPEHQDLIHRCRLDNSVSRLGQVARSVHWTQSNLGARTKVMQALTTTGDSWQARDLVVVLRALSPTADEQARTRADVLQALAVRQHPDHVLIGLLKALTALAPTAEDQASGCAAALEALPRITDQLVFRDLVEVLPALASMPDGQALARAAVMHAISAADPWKVFALAKVLPTLAPVIAEKTQARLAVADAVTHSATHRMVIALVRALPALDATAEERSWARDATMRVVVLDVDNPLDGSELEAALIDLAPTLDEQAEAHAAVLQALTSTTSGWSRNIQDLTKVLIALAPEHDKQGQARASVLQALAASRDPLQIRNLGEAVTHLSPTLEEESQTRSAILQALSVAEDPWVLHCLAEVLVTLRPTIAEQERARAAIMQALKLADEPKHTCQITEVLAALVPTADDRAYARGAMMQALSATDAPAIVHGLVSCLPALKPTGAERKQACKALLHTVSTTESLWFSGLPALPALAPTVEERAQVRTAVLHALTDTVDLDHFHDLDEILPALAHTTDEQAQARTEVLLALTIAEEPWAVDLLVDALMALEPTITEQAQARELVLRALAARNDKPNRIRDLVDVLMNMAPSAGDQSQARSAVLHALAIADSLEQTDRLTKMLRSLSTYDSWMEWVTHHP
jgi:hypothetical protein